MLNIGFHKTTLVKILKEIYTDPLLRITLGFKGGTAAMLFYNLPRFSVDLDFDLFDQGKKETILARLKEILSQFGKVVQAIDKKNTIFFLLVYQKGLRNLKVEISKRASRGTYEIKNYLGISVLVMKKEDMAAGKLAALLTRKKFAARDLFDLWFFLKNDWMINASFVKEKTGISLEEALEKAAKNIRNIKKNQLLSGLGDLLDTRQKIWVKEKLQEELLFYLRLYQSK